MSEVLTIQTAFEDLRSLAAGLVGRIEAQRLILYGADPYDEGSEIGFAILLADGSPALEGTGRVTAAVDGGEARDAGIRYDVVIDDLQLDVVNDAKLESIVIAMNPEEGDRITGEVSIEDLDAQAAEEEAAAVASEAEEAAVEESPVEDAAAEPVTEEPVAEEAEAEEIPVEDEAEEPVAEEIPVEDEAEEPVAEEAEAEEAAADDWSDEGDEPPADDDEGDAEAEEAASDDWSDEGDGDAAEDLPAEDEGSGWDDEEAAAAPADDLDEISSDFGESPPAAEPPGAPAPPPGFQVSHVGDEGVILERTAMASDWVPTPMERPEVNPPSGFFAYGGPIPIPGGPPHPELQPGTQVQPAPSPATDAGAGEAVAAAAYAADAADDYQQAEAADDAELAAHDEPADEYSEEALEAHEGEFEEAAEEAAVEADVDVEDVEVAEGEFEDVAEEAPDQTAEVELEELEEL